MKQHITVEQLNELDGKHKDMWISWINKDHLPWDGATYVRIEDDDKVAWVTDIGQMIEFLDENDPGEWAINNTNSDGWYINSQNLYEPVYSIPDNAELCDALWEAVKSVLEKA